NEPQMVADLLALLASHPAGRGERRLELPGREREESLAIEAGAEALAALELEARVGDRGLEVLERLVGLARLVVRAGQAQAQRGVAGMAGRATRALLDLDAQALGLERLDGRLVAGGLGLGQHGLGALDGQVAARIEQALVLRRRGQRVVERRDRVVAPTGGGVGAQQSAAQVDRGGLLEEGGAQAGQVVARHVTGRRSRRSQAGRAAARLLVRAAQRVAILDHVARRLRRLVARARERALRGEVLAQPLDLGVVAVDRVRALELLDRDLDVAQLVVQPAGVLEREEVLRVGVEARLPGG